MRKASAACVLLYRWTVAVIRCAEEQQRQRPMLHKLVKVERRHAHVQELLGQLGRREQSLQEAMLQKEEAFAAAEAQYSAAVTHLKSLQQKQARVNRLVGNTRVRLWDVYDAVFFPSFCGFLLKVAHRSLGNKTRTFWLDPKRRCTVGEWPSPISQAIVLSLLAAS